LGYTAFFKNSAYPTEQKIQLGHAALRFLAEAQSSQVAQVCYLRHFTAMIGMEAMPQNAGC